MIYDDDWRKSTFSTYENCVEVSSWRKSSRSIGNGACVEIGEWRKSNRFMFNSECVEVGQHLVMESVVGIRDTTEVTHPYRITLEVPSRAWHQFATQLKSGWQPQ